MLDQTFSGKYAADAALAKKKKSSVLDNQRRRMGLAGARAKTGEKAPSKKILLASPDADRKE